MISNAKAGTKVYVATDARYMGRFTIECIERAAVALGGQRIDAYVVTDGTRRGRIAADQAFSTANEAKANVYGGMDPAGLSALARR